MRMAWNRSKWLYITFLFCLLSLVGFAQEPVDSTVWENLRETHVYDKKSSLENLGRNQINKPIGLDLWWDMLKIFLLALLAIGLVILVVKLLNKSKGSIPKVINSSLITHPTVHSSANDLDSALQAYVAMGDYREAIGIWYQIALKKLIEHKLVKGEKDKTNWEYVYELKTHPLARAFKDLTRYHERVRYGTERISSEIYSLRQQDFQSFILTVK